MFVISMKPNRKKVLAYIFVGLIFVAGLFVFFISRASNQTSKNKVSTVTLTTNAQRIDYLKTFGWEVETEAKEICEVAIPLEFDDVYSQYNSLQKEQGFDLLSYSGKRAKRFSYTISNYPNNEKDVVANLLIYNERVIGADVCSLRLDGFMHGLTLTKE